MDALPAAFEERWTRWLLESNRRRTRIGLFIAARCCLLRGARLHPGAVSSAAVPLGLRAAILLVTFAAFPCQDTLLDRYSAVVSSAYVTLIASASAP